MCVCVCVLLFLLTKSQLVLLVVVCLPHFQFFLHIMDRVRIAGPAEATGKPILDLNFFRGGSDVDSSGIMLSKGQTDLRLHHFLPRCRFNAFLSHTTPFVNKMAVTHYEKAGVLRKIVKIHINTK